MKVAMQNTEPEESLRMICGSGAVTNQVILKKEAYVDTE